MIVLRPLIAGCLFAVFFPMIARAGPCRCDGVDALLDEARRAHVGGDMAGAMRRYARLQCCLTHSHATTGVSLVTVLCESAKVLADAGSIESAIESYERCQAQAEFDPARRVGIQAAIEDLGARRRGALGVLCAEAELRVALVAPESRGDLPCPARWDDLTPGRWEIEVRSPDGRRLPRMVKVPPGGIEWIEVGTRSALRVVDAPAGARATVDGHPLPITDSIVDVPAGPVTIRVTAPGHLPSTREVELPPLETVRVSMPLLVDQPPVPAVGDPFPPAVRWVGIAVGSGMLAGSGIALGAANTRYEDAAREGRLFVRSPNLTDALDARDRARMAVAEGESAEIAAYTLLGVGAGLVLGSASLFLMETLGAGSAQAGVGGTL